MSYTRIAYAADYGVALLLHSLLESEGFAVQDVSNVSHVSLAGADQGYYIAVEPGQVEAARALLVERDLQQHLLG